MSRAKSTAKSSLILNSSDSSMVESYGYDHVESKMYIRFSRSGEVYEYSNVSKKIWDAFVDSSSKGRFLNENVIRKFPTKLVITNPTASSVQIAASAAAAKKNQWLYDAMLRRTLDKNRITNILGETRDNLEKTVKRVLKKNVVARGTIVTASSKLPPARFTVQTRKRVNALADYAIVAVRSEILPKKKPIHLSEQDLKMIWSRHGLVTAKQKNLGDALDSIADNMEALTGRQVSAEKRPGEGGLFITVNVVPREK